MVPTVDVKHPNVGGRCSLTVGLHLPAEDGHARVGRRDWWGGRGNDKLKKQTDVQCTLVSILFTNHRAVGELHRFNSPSDVFPGGAFGTFAHAVVPVRMRSELLDSLAAQQAGVSGLCPESRS